ncbi:MAG: hypothetical protein KDD53_05955 [Bdellovibrionales bacterium]|nr:hypothetical protein [Bdellovibrionales bacterium]
MPFNGRWREYFAELVLREAKKSDKIVVVLNLSFVPQAWAKSELIRYTDIGQSADAARQKALLKANGIDEQKALEEQKVKEESAKKSLANIAELKEGKTIHIPIPENLTYAYQHTRDFIFSPFLRITWMLRTYSSPAVILSSAFVLLLGAIVMFPDLSAQRAKLVELAKNFDFEWKDVTTSETSSGEQQTEIQVKSIPTLDNDEDLSEQEQPDLPLEQVTIDDDTELEESDETLHETALPVANVKWIEACALPLISDCLANPTLDHGCDGFFE